MFDSFRTNIVVCITIVQICITNQLFIYLLSVSIIYELVSYFFTVLAWMYDDSLAVFYCVEIAVTYNEDPRSARMQEGPDV